MKRTASRVEERTYMVRRQIRGRGVKSARVLEAMMAVPRHCFVPEKFAHDAYGDHPVDIGSGQTISQPYMVAAMTELLDLMPMDRVLEVGTGSGYQAAVLAHLATAVVTIERIAKLAESARGKLTDLGFTNVTVLDDDGTLGHPEGAPYDAIIVTAAGPRVPEALKEQLSVGGRLVCPVGPREVQKLILIRRTEDGYEEGLGMSCLFVPLIGQEGWKPGREWQYRPSD
jgi:protein-L-isoaspartate(D-aspartate) O-methyltransferase